MGQVMKRYMDKRMMDKNDIKELRKGLHYVVLLGVSIYVFMDMEERVSTFKRQMSSSMSEREYEQQQAYKQIMEQLKEFDGESPAIENIDTSLPTYKFQFVDPDDDE